MKKIKYNQKCNLCGSSENRLIRESYDFLTHLGGKFKIVQCCKCGLIFVNPKPTNISDFYPPSYEPYNISNKDFHQNLYNQLLNKYYEKNKSRWDYFLSFIFEKVYNPIPFKKNGRILDLGCGNGLGLYNLQNCGWEVYGLDISKMAVEFAQRELGLKNVKYGSLVNNNYPNNFFDVVVLNYVIEHLPDPKVILKKIKKILKYKGLLLITTPNFESVNSIIFRSYWFPLETPRHLYLFTSETFKKLLFSIGGFRIRKVKYDISTYSLGRSLAYLFGNGKNVNKFWMSVKIFFLPLTIVLALVKKSDTMCFYVVKNNN